MNFKKNVKKAGAGLLISALAIGTAFAWLTNSDTATKHNDIKVGSLQVVFDNQTNVVTLTDNNAIPMTREYAILKTTPYSFTIDNTGNMNADYTIKAIAEDGNTISNDLIEISLDSEAKESISNNGRGAGWDEVTAQAQADNINAAHPEARASVVNNGDSTYYVAYHSYKENIETFATSDAANNKVSELTAADPSKEYVVSNGSNGYTVALVHYGDEAVSGTWHKLSDVTLLANEGIVVGNSHSYKMYVRIVDTAVNADILGNSASFHLEVEAVQNNEAVDTHANFYQHTNGNVIDKATYSQFEASIQANYEPYFGDVYKYTKDNDPGWSAYKSVDGLTFYEYEIGPNESTVISHATTTDEYNVGEAFVYNPSWIIISKTEATGISSTKIQ